MAMKSLIGLVLILIIGRLCYLTFAKIKTYRVSDHLLCGISVAHDKPERFCLGSSTWLRFTTRASQEMATWD
jgi:hypothetical protein